ncbi:MAG: DUF885 domain-containing protein [Bryobacteraceae bacterium]
MPSAGLVLPLIALIGVIACSITEPSRSSAQIEELADEYVNLRLQYDPALAREIGVRDASDMHFPDRSPAALADLRSHEDTIVTKLKAIGGAGTKDFEPTYSVLVEELESRRGLRVCRSELWDLSQMEGWQIEMPSLAATQPVATPDERRRALRLWSTLPAYLQTDMANLRAGLASGYSVPRAVVTRVLEQLERLLAATPEDCPFYLPAKRAKDPAFANALREEISVQINPAIERYADFLRSEYLPEARTSLGMSDLPNGSACCRAYLERYTTTHDSPELVFEAGKKIVAESTKEIQSIGARLYQTTKMAEIVQRSHEDPNNRFNSSAQLIQFSRAMVERSEGRSHALFFQLPSQAVIVKALPEYQRGSGVSSHYQPNQNDEEPATFWISTDDWADETRGATEITAVHETVPGHHLQIATARRLQPATKLAKLVYNSAYVEGWANYAERLSEETSYEMGGLEILSLREEARKRLGTKFDLRAFHQAVLEQGSIPLSALRASIENWIESSLATR